MVNKVKCPKGWHLSKEADDKKKKQAKTVMVAEFAKRKAEKAKNGQDR